MRWLLVLTPISPILAWLHWDPILVLLASALSIIALANLLRDATEALSRFLGPAKGGLLNATLNNAPEIIIGFFALKHGLTDMVKASITGSILSSLLFGLGLSVLAGGLQTPGGVMKFDMETARLHGGLLLLATFGLIIPAAFNFSTSADREISLEISVILFIAYLFSVFLTLAKNPPDSESNTGRSLDAKAEGNDWGKGLAMLILTVAAAALACVSEIMTDALGPAAKSLGFSPLFVGVFVLALLGNMAELLNSVHFARNNQLDIALGITLGGSLQTALMIAPLLVFFGVAIGQDMNLLFSKFELVAIVMTTYAVITILQNGMVKWGGGVFLIAIYVMLGFGFFYAPT